MAASLSSSDPPHPWTRSKRATRSRHPGTRARTAACASRTAPKVCPFKAPHLQASEPLDGPRPLLPQHRLHTFEEFSGGRPREGKGCSGRKEEGCDGSCLAHVEGRRAGTPTQAATQGACGPARVAGTPPGADPAGRCCLQAAHCFGCKSAVYGCAATQIEVVHGRPECRLRKRGEPHDCDRLA